MLRDYVRRLLRLAAGIAVSSLGIVLMLQANVGLEPWSVLQQGMTRVMGLTYGTASIIAGAAASGLAIVFGESFGIGTVISALGLGSLINLNFSLLHFRPAEVHQENIAETLRYLRS